MPADDILDNAQKKVDSALKRVNKLDSKLDNEADDAKYVAALKSLHKAIGKFLEVY